MNERARTLISLVLLATAALVYFSFASTDAPMIVFTKAANICLECIGIG